MAATIEPRSGYRFDGVVTAFSSISHIGDNFGANSRLRREKIVQPDGAIEEVPVISGNGIRGLLRDMGMRYMLDRIGNPELSLPAFYFLFSGGALSKVSGRGLDVDQARKLRELIPLVGVLGGAVGNQIMPGRADIGKLLPICKETAHLLPPVVLENRTLCSVWEYLQEEAYTRKDDEKDDRLRGYLAPPEVKLLDVKAEKKRGDREAGKELDTEAGQHQQMRYYVETFAAGTPFFWSIRLNDVSEIEFEAFFSCLIEFARRPVIGGKGNVGHGVVDINFSKWVHVNPRMDVAEGAVNVPLGNLYLSHLEKRGGEILTALGEMA